MSDPESIAADLTAILDDTEDMGDPEDLRRAVRRLAFVVAFLVPEIETDGEAFWVSDQTPVGRLLRGRK